MKGLITIEVVTGAISLTRGAFFFQGNRTRTGIRDFFNLVGRRLFVFPNIYKATSAVAKPVAILGFLFTSKSRKDNYGEGNGKFFHIHKILIMVGFCKSKANHYIINW